MNKEGRKIKDGIFFKDSNFSIVLVFSAEILKASRQVISFWVKKYKRRRTNMYNSTEGRKLSSSFTTKWRRRDSNSRPSACKADALPTELRPHKEWAQVDSNHRPHAYQACALTGWAMSPNKKPGNHLFSQTVPHPLPSAAYAFTSVFDMDTGVSHKRIITRQKPF